MASYTDSPLGTPSARKPLGLRLFHSIPIVGWTIRDMDEKGDDNLLWGLISIASAWGIAALLFGYPGIIIPALLLVPTIFLYLILVSWG